MDNVNKALLAIFLVGRIIFGGYFIRAAYHHFTRNRIMAGYAASKGVPMPSAAIFVTGILLLLGGLSILLGAKPFAGCILLLIFLIPVTFTMHSYWKDQDPGMKQGNNINFYKNMALVGAVLMLMAARWPHEFRLW